MTFRRGDILWMRCDPSIGVEPTKTRPCVVVSNDRANGDPDWPSVTVVSTRGYSKQDAWRPYLVDIRAPRSTLKEGRFANCSQVMTWDRARIARHEGRLSLDAVIEVDRALKLHLSLDEELLEVHERQVEYDARAVRRTRARS